MENPLFLEVQQFRHPLLWVFLLAISLLVLFACGWAFWHWGPSSNAKGILPKVITTGSSVLILAVLVLLYTASLTIQVKDDRLQVRFFPFHLKFHAIPLDGVEQIEVVTYRPLADYGGWGVRYGKQGKAYTVDGSRGVLITYAKGNRRALLLGSRKAEDLSEAIRQILPARGELRNPSTARPLGEPALGRSQPTRERN